MSSVLVQFKVPFHVYERLSQMEGGDRSANLIAKRIVENAVYQGDFLVKSNAELLEQTVKLNLLMQQLLSKSGAISEDDMPEFMAYVRESVDEYIIQKGLKNG